MKCSHIFIKLSFLIVLTLASTACGRDSDFDPNATDDEVVAEEPEEEMEDPGEGNGEEEENTDDVPPTAPTNLTAENTTPSTTDLSWEAATDNVGVSSYKVYQDEVEITRISTTSYTVMGLSPDTSFMFTVTALDAATNESEFSEPVSITTAETSDTEAPTAPTNLRTTAIAQTTLDLSWNAATDNVAVTSYAVYQDGVEVAMVTTTTYQVVDLTPNTAYDFRVLALDIAGNPSEFSATLSVTTLEAPDTEAPSAPTNLMVSNLTETTVNLNWNAATDNVAVISYRLFQDNIEIATVTNTNYMVSGLLPSTNYAYTVTASDAVGNESDLSAVLNITTATPPDTEAPTTPMNLVANNTTQTTTNLSWNASTDNVEVIGYRVFQDNAQIAVVTTTNSQVTGLMANTSYDFNVTAIDAAGNESSQSTTLTVMTEEEPQNTVDQVLVFTKTEGFRHASIAIGVSTLTALGTSNNFEVTQTENSSDFNLSNLQQYQLVVFLNTTGDVLDNTQQGAFEQYIQGGGSFMGVHAATDTEFNWPWYGELVGAYFDNHPAIQEAAMDIVDATHPSTTTLPLRWLRTDEWYNFRNMNPAINSLINLDESSYSGGEDGATHPIAWFHEFDGGRSFYTAMGHTEASYNEPDFRAHLLGGILYCLNR